jgi:hypothetical protein
MKVSKFIKECREHNVLKNLSIYVVSSWVLLQVIDLISEPLGFSNKVVVYVLIGLLVGFPLYIYGVWKFQLAPNVKKPSEWDEYGVPIPGKFSKSPFQKLYFSFLGIIGLICAGMALYLANMNIVKPRFEALRDSGNKIAVLKFANMTGETTKDLIGEMAVDWIIHGITRNKLGQVISPQIIDDYSRVLRAGIVPGDENVMVTDYLKPSKIIEGEYYLRGNRLIFQSAITDEQMDRTLISFEPVECDSDSPLDCIEALNQRILGYLKIEEKPLESLEEHPPKYEAYELFSKAKALRASNESLYLEILNEAIAADPSYFEPKTYRLIYYYNQGSYHIADSLLQEIKKESGMYYRQQMLLNLYQALLDGNFRNAYKYQREEYNITPMHLETNSNMMVFSLQLVNKPEGVDSIFREIDMSELDLANCPWCENRLKIKALSDIQLGNYASAIELLEGFGQQEGFWVLKKILLRAYIRAGMPGKAADLIRNLRIVADPAVRSDLELFAAMELLREGKKAEAFSYLDTAIAALGETANPLENPLGECLFYREDFEAAEPVLARTYAADSTNFNTGALLAITYHRNGKPEAADALVRSMENRQAPYQYGELHYSLAQYYAGIGQRQDCLENLLKAIAEGHWYETGSFQNDPLLRDYYQEEEFQQVLTYWQ